MDRESLPFMPLMQPEELIRRIDGYGFLMFVGEDGQVHGKPKMPGTKVPLAMQPLLDELRLQNAAVAQLLRDRQSGEESDVVDLNGITKEEAEPWLDRVNAGEYRLVPGTKVTYVTSTGLTYMKLERVARDG